MVRDGVSGGWRLPATDVQKGETLEMALRRVLRHELGMEFSVKPELRGFYAAEARQTGLYVLRVWQRLSAPETSFFEVGSLPAAVPKMMAERIRRLAEGRTISEV
jgi:ADP-ribose pyrophosphatase YjhB (NUDIX family)